MDGGDWWVKVHRVARVRHDLATKPSPPGETFKFPIPYHWKEIFFTKFQINWDRFSQKFLKIQPYHLFLLLTLTQQVFFKMIHNKDGSRTRMLSEEKELSYKVS